VLVQYNKNTTRDTRRDELNGTQTSLEAVKLIDEAFMSTGSLNNIPSMDPNCPTDSG